MLYFYAPSFAFPGPDDGDCFRPGVQVADTIEAAEMPLGSSSPHYDRDLPRFVLVCPDDTPALSGWESKTAEQVRADYPGVI